MDRDGEYAGSTHHVEDGVKAALEQVLATSADRYDLTSVGTARQGSALDLNYRIRLRAGCSPSALVAELHALTGVESVDLKREAYPLDFLCCLFSQRSLSMSEYQYYEFRAMDKPLNDEEIDDRVLPLALRLHRPVSPMD